jgi:predicted O-methyltransferase YrrM
LTNKVKIVIGPATTTLLDINPDASFDLAFIDADKQSNVEYFVQAKRLVRNGGVIIVDNVVRNGQVADPEQSDPSIEGVRRLLEYIQKDSTVEATTLGTVGEKGYDGFLYAINKPSFN